tara:strand:- start:582 stop:719 length:138 start_codon:yes stop_codon:yes gene_type:complete
MQLQDQDLIYLFQQQVFLLQLEVVELVKLLLVLQDQMEILQLFHQ